MDYIKAMINELMLQIEALSGVVLSGTCKSFEEYKEKVGKIQGLNVGLNMLNDLVRKIEKGEDVY